MNGKPDTLSRPNPTGHNMKKWIKPLIFLAGSIIFMAIAGFVITGIDNNYYKPQREAAKQQEILKKHDEDIKKLNQVKQDIDRYKTIEAIEKAKKQK